MQLIKYISFFFSCIEKLFFKTPKFDKLPPIKKKVFLDPAFSGLEINSVKKALQAWSDKTKNFVIFKFLNWPDNFNFLKEYDHFIVIQRVTSWDENVLKLEAELGHTIRGYAASSVENDSTRDLIFLVMDRIRSLNELQNVTIHEVGHNLKLGHNSDFSIMNGSKLDIVGKITKIDLINLYKKWELDA